MATYFKVISITLKEAVKMTDERKALAKKIKSYRKEHNLSQFEFAED